MLHDFAAISRTIIEFISILIIMCGVVVAIFRGCRLFFAMRSGSSLPRDAWIQLRLSFEDTLMLGLQFLMAADIIGTISDPDLQGVIVLSVIVLLRVMAIGPMLVGRELEEINWEPVKMGDPRLTVHPDWLKEFRDFAGRYSSSLTLHQSARIERTEKGFQICIYNRTDYDALLAMLENRGFSLPTADEWAYLCGGGCRTLFPWGDGLDYSMRLRWFADMDEDENLSLIHI